METLQERMLARTDDPWWVLAVCVLLNRTRGSVAQTVLEDLYRIAPTAEALAFVPLPELETVLRPLGLQRIRAVRLRAAARDYHGVETLSRNRTSFGEAVDTALRKGGIAGCGPYALEAWRMIVLGDRGFEPLDRILRARMLALAPR